MRQTTPTLLGSAAKCGKPTGSAAQAKEFHAIEPSAASNGARIGMLKTKDWPGVRITPESQTILKARTVFKSTGGVVLQLAGLHPVVGPLTSPRQGLGSVV